LHLVGHFRILYYCTPLSLSTMRVTCPAHRTISFKNSNILHAHTVYLHVFIDLRTNSYYFRILYYCKPLLSTMRVTRPAHRNISFKDSNILHAHTVYLHVSIDLRTNSYYFRILYYCKPLLSTMRVTCPAHRTISLKNSNILHAHTVYLHVFIDLRTNSYYFPSQH